MSISVQLGRRLIQQESKPYVIAEIGGIANAASHDATEQAKQGGADAAFQSQGRDSRIKTLSFLLGYSKEATSQYELFQKYDGFGRRNMLNWRNIVSRLG